MNLMSRFCGVSMVSCLESDMFRWNENGDGTRVVSFESFARGGRR